MAAVGGNRPAVRGSEPLSLLLAVDGAAGPLGERSGGDRPVGEVLTVHHVRRMAACGPEKADVEAERGEPSARPDRVHRLEQ